jgi:HK97 family phage prohead protease
MRELERRNVAQPVELRASRDSKGPGTLFGYAAKFNQYSQNLGGFVEQVDPAAFTKSLADGVRVLCRYNHEDMALLGTTDAATLRLGVDDVGLWYEDDLPDTQQGRDCAVLAGRGDLRYSSFAFYCIEDEWSISENDFPLRTLMALQLVDVAPVNSPAYLDSTVAVRSLSDRISMPVEQVRAKLEALGKPSKPAVRKGDAEDVNAITQALGWVTSIDAITTVAMDELSAYLAVPNPDADDDPAETNSHIADAEQRETHSVPASVRSRLMELEAIK